MSRGKRILVFLALAALVLAAAILLWARDRLTIHDEAPAYVHKFLVNLSRDWSPGAAQPYLAEAAGGEALGLKLRCYAQLGKLRSHGRPMTSDLGLLGWVSYVTQARFDNGKATVYTVLDRRDGSMRIYQLYISAGKVTKATRLNDHSWCSSFRPSPG